MTDARRVMALARGTAAGRLRPGGARRDHRSVDLGLVEAEEVLELIGSKPERTELVLTGRDARKRIER